MTEISRRTLFRLSGLSTLAAGAVTFEPILVSPASAVTNRQRFNLTASGHPLLTDSSGEYGIDTGVSTIPQSFGFDEAASVDSLFVVQRTELGAQTDNGNLVITRFLKDGRTRFVPNGGQMKVLGAGHGGGLGVEHYPGVSDPYLWIECNVNAGGRGEGICRIKYRDTTTVPDTRPNLDRNPAVPNVAPVLSGWMEPRAYIDHRFQQLALCYKNADGNRRRIVVYCMADIRTSNAAVINNLSSLTPKLDRVVIRHEAPFNEPYEPNVSKEPVQGFCVYGDFAYLWQGGAGEKTRITSYDLAAPPPPAGAGNEYVDFVERADVTIWKDMARREAEGIAVRHDFGSDGVGDQLVYGLVKSDDTLWLAYKQGFTT